MLLTRRVGPACQRQNAECQQHGAQPDLRMQRGGRIEPDHHGQCRQVQVSGGGLNVQQQRQVQQHLARRRGVLRSSCGAQWRRLNGASGESCRGGKRGGRGRKHRFERSRSREVLNKRRLGRLGAAGHLATWSAGQPYVCQNPGSQSQIRKSPFAVGTSASAPSPGTASFTDEAINPPAYS